MASDAFAPLPNPPVQFVDVCGHRLEYRVIASRGRKPPLLFLHEGLGSVSLWRDFPARVAHATGCRTVVYSRFGFGRSSPRAKGYTPRFMHEEALEILPALRASLEIRHPVLVGHSTGASMALIHAGAGRWDVAGVVAMAPLTFVEKSNLDSIRAAKGIYLTGMREKLARHHDDVDSVFHGWNDIWLDPQFHSWNIADDMAGIRCPILAMLGEDDEYSTDAQIDLLARRATAAASFDFLRLAGCGHAPHRDQPEVVIKAIADFVDRLEPNEPG